MLTLEQSYVNTLIDLGLTQCQAKVFLELVRLGLSTAKTISAASKVTRQDVYRIMPTLQKLGLVETVVGSPTFFSAIAIEDAVALLLENKVSEHQELHIRTKDLLQNFNNHKNKKHGTEENQFVLIPQKQPSLRRRKKAIETVEMSFDAISSRKRFAQALFHLFETVNDAASRGVKIRFITEKPSEDEPFSKELESLLKNARVEVRFLDIPPKAVVTIFDQKEASILTVAKAGWAQSPTLWTNNPSFVAVVQDHFDATWEKALPVS
jgi:sugar-specific transcriptional regulator TrmB